MTSKHKRRLENIEAQSRAGKSVIAVVDVRELSASEAAQRLDAKRAELDHSDSAATLIILRYR